MRLAIGLLFALLHACAQAAPFTPGSDSDVVEKLPAATDPAARNVDALRRQLQARPDDVNLHLEVAQRYFDLAMAQGDPRYVGYAFAAIKPIGERAQRNADYWFVKGLLQQYSHDFGAAMESLAKASELRPNAVGPVAWRAAIDMVEARYADAENECRKLTQIATVLLARGCSAFVQADTGQLRQAYEGLEAVLAAEPNAPTGVVMWVRNRLAEWATRLQRYADAEQQFQSALKLGITDQFLLASYSDFLLLRRRPQEVLRLLAGWERSDVLLLRLALAGKAAHDPRAKEWAQQLADRFTDAARRGDTLHEQEAARFALDIEGEPKKALALAASNYAKQKEPRDAEILMRAALAAHEARQAQPALDWLRRTGFEDPEMAKLAQQLAAEGATR
jgi:tetratricopeptide (TPR) repeat protein